MSNVGLGFGAFAPQIRIQRRPKNPMDKTTLVSIFPRAIRDYKATVYPGDHTIPAAPKDGFSLLVLSGASWFKEMEEGQPMLEIPITSIQQAEAFIRDYSIGLLGYVPGQASPGLFYIPGAYNEKTILEAKTPDITDDDGRIISKSKSFKELIAAAKIQQDAWFKRLIEMSDVMWARTNGNPLAINDDARLGAELLGLKNKPWMGDLVHLEKTACPACGFAVNTAFPICPNCKAVVNEGRAKELNLKFAS